MGRQGPRIDLALSPITPAGVLLCAAFSRCLPQVTPGDPEVVQNGLRGDRKKASFSRPHFSQTGLRGSVFDAKPVSGHPENHTLQRILCAASRAGPFLAENRVNSNNLAESSRRYIHTVTLLHARGFIPLEMGVISAKKEALQALSISKNLARDALTFR